MQHSKTVFKLTKYSAYEFSHDYTSITDVIERCIATGKKCTLVLPLLIA